jgi:uncharacterized protein (DUF427 family)
MTFMKPHEPDDPPGARAHPPGGLRAVWRGRTLAESDRTRELDGYRYFPRDAVRMELLRASPRTPDDLECPHGVQFYDVGEGASRSERAAWSYESPGTRMQPVDHWIGFWEDVDIVPASGGAG